ncbi:hypothetical protein QTP88_022311 [Uroleucon formosanum]
MFLKVDNKYTETDYIQKSTNQNKNKNNIKIIYSHSQLKIIIILKASGIDRKSQKLNKNRNDRIESISRLNVYAITLLCQSDISKEAAYSKKFETYYVVRSSPANNG